MGGAPTNVFAAGPATTVLGTDVLPGLSGLSSTPTDAATPVQVGITMTNPNAAAQNLAYHAIYTPGSPQYQQFLTADQVAQQFGLPEATYNTVLTWATRDGLTLLFSPNTREYLVLTGTVAQAESTFAVSIDNFTTNGHQFYANTTGPTVPAGVGVAGVIGLNNLLKAHTFNHTPPSSAPHGPTPQQSICGEGSASA